MFLIQTVLSLFLFSLGILGIILNRRSILIILMCIEIILLSVNLKSMVFSVYLDDFSGQTFSFFILTVAAAESAVGLAIIIIYYRLRGTTAVYQPILLKG